MQFLESDSSSWVLSTASAFAGASGACAGDRCPNRAWFDEDDDLESQKVCAVFSIWDLVHQYGVSVPHITAQIKQRVKQRFCFPRAPKRWRTERLAAAIWSTPTHRASEGVLTALESRDVVLCAALYTAFFKLTKSPVWEKFGMHPYWILFFRGMIWPTKSFFNPCTK